MGPLRQFSCGVCLHVIISVDLMLANAIHDFVMGKRPNNSVFSYNYHNISHIVRFFRRASASLPSRQFRILDVGGGACPYYEIFAGKILQYVVADVETSLPRTDSRPIAPVEAVAEALPFRDGSFDIVISNQVLEHVDDERKTLAESFRVLKKGGLFIGSAPHISPIHLEPWDYRRFTSLGLKKLLSESQFHKIVIESNGGAHRAAALMVLMDWYLTPYQPGKQQRFKTRKHFLLFPVNGFINISAILLDAVLGDSKRSPSNYCWMAEKP